MWDALVARLPWRERQDVLGTLMLYTSSVLIAREETTSTEPSGQAHESLQWKAYIGTVSDSGPS